VYNNYYLANRGGVSYRYKTKKLNVSLGADYQHAELNGTLIYPQADKVDKTFDNVLPNFRLNYKISQNSNLRMFYRTSTNNPSILQLQNVLDNSNPLMLSTGNPNLKQEYSHNLFGNFSTANTQNGTNFFLMFGGGYTQNTIGDKTITAEEDMTVEDANVFLAKGVRLTMPVNFDYSWNLQTMASYGFPIKLISSNLNLNVGYTYSKSPGYANEQFNWIQSNNLNGGFTLGSNISENVDFTISYNSNYTYARNSVKVAGGNVSYLDQSAGVNFNWVIWNGIVLRNDVSAQFRQGISSDAYDKNYVLWNASIAKKVFKSQKGEVRLSIYDILNQNTSLSRNVTAQYIEDVRSNVLKQYVLFSFTYTLREFKQQRERREGRDGEDGSPGPPPGDGKHVGPPPGGGTPPPGGPGGGPGGPMD
jgi:outer membrane receptor protein involved in Fe transport